MNVSVCPLQPPPADLDSLFLYVEDVMDVSSRLLSLLDQQQLACGDPLYLQTLCETLEDVSPLICSVFVLLQAVSAAPPEMMLCRCCFFPRSTTELKTKSKPSASSTLQKVQTAGCGGPG